MVHDFFCHTFLPIKVNHDACSVSWVPENTGLWFRKARFWIFHVKAGDLFFELILYIQPKSSFFLLFKFHSRAIISRVTGNFR